LAAILPDVCRQPKRRQADLFRYRSKILAEEAGKCWMAIAASRVIGHRELRLILSDGDWHDH
jgi:hypothetical protein